MKLKEIPGVDGSDFINASYINVRTSIVNEVFISNLTSTLRDAVMKTATLLQLKVKSV